jgi:hypothetical protein
VIRLKGTVEYDDGTQVEFETGTAALAEWELYALRHGYPIGTAAPPMLSLLVVAWSVLGGSEGFDVWRRRVVGIDMDPTPTIPPTLPEAFSA